MYCKANRAHWYYLLIVNSCKCTVKLTEHTGRKLSPPMGRSHLMNFLYNNGIINQILLPVARKSTC